jgi:hypothetical protein
MSAPMRATTNRPFAEQGSKSGQTIFVCGTAPDRLMRAVDDSP